MEPITQMSIDKIIFFICSSIIDYKTDIVKRRDGKKVVVLPDWLIRRGFSLLTMAVSKRGAKR
ncbi:MAG: hypothetical protein Q8N72_01360 [Candidatus Omnitrophota bacterium]|nr:hypothetical protein [Candidatus Omnitrophota bacterium]